MGVTGSGRETPKNAEGSFEEIDCLGELTNIAQSTRQII
jgi:hypothetical protein